MCGSCNASEIQFPDNVWALLSCLLAFDFIPTYNSWFFYLFKHISSAYQICLCLFLLGSNPALQSHFSVASASSHEFLWQSFLLCLSEQTWGRILSRGGLVWIHGRNFISLILNFLKRKVDPIPFAVLQQSALAFALSLASGFFTGKTGKVLSYEVM